MPKYCILPGGNASEFPGLDSEIIGRGVVADYSELASGGRIYRIRKGLRKLPRDEKGHYLGDDNSGHSVYNMGKADEYKSDIGGSDWIRIK